MIFYFIDHFNSKSFLRKPNPGLFLRLLYKLLLDKTFYIGDDPRDVIASYNANTKCLYVGKKSVKVENKSYMNDIILKNLSTEINLKRKSILDL